MALVSAGCLVTRGGADRVEVLLVHPHKSTFRRPVFGIPKGLVEAGEELEAAAARETLEETGLLVNIIAPLGSVRQKSGKVVHAFHAAVAPESHDRIDELGRCRFPDEENDVCRFYPIAKAYNLMIPAQREFLDRLQGIASKLPIEKSGTPRRAKPAKARRSRQAALRRK
jgi:predicted NUDIX family NTP pyrophosphohydrolase